MMHDDIQAEALRLIAAGEARGITLRLLGGLAVRLHAPSAAHRTLARGYPDMDFVAPARTTRAVEGFLQDEGYTPDKQFNLLQGTSRLLFRDMTRNRQIDVFLGDFAMCHRVPLSGRLGADQITLPLAELLLTKLQIVQINEKDLRDVCALLLDHPPGAGDDETINLSRITSLCAGDWGWWRTVTGNLGKVTQYLEQAELPVEHATTIRERTEEIRHALDTAPKTTRWKLRAALGDRVRWYEEAEEVDRG
jgi:hypothetical protein